MKSIVYVSKVKSGLEGYVVPLGLPKVVARSRVSNRAQSIRSSLYYKVGRYLQVIEGDDHNVDTLFGKIARDSRHTDVLTILNVTSRNRSFDSSSSMKLMFSVSKDHIFQNFMQAHSDMLSSLSEEQQEALAFFDDSFALKSPTTFDDLSKGVSRDSRFRQGRFRLSRWPDFSVVNPEPKILDLCARMLKADHTFEELKQVSAFEEHQQFEKLFLQFDKLGILENSPIERDARVVEKRHARRLAGNFYKKMTRFLQRK